MVKLNKTEIEWLRNNYPQMVYNEKRSVITGLFFINHSYNGIIIKDCFNIEVRLYEMRSREEYPKVYNTDGRIQKIAKRKNIKIEDLHVYEDNSLCLGLPARFREYYPEGFTLQSFFKHLSEHLYWVAYYERYNKAPWPAELHGDDAMIELLCEDIDDTLRNKVKFEVLRKLYKKKFGHGIAKSKLARRLKEQSFITRFIGL